ncbi:mCG66423, partial [Mus musculus]
QISGSFFKDDALCSRVNGEEGAHVCEEDARICGIQTTPLCLARSRGDGLAMQRADAGKVPHSQSVWRQSLCFGPAGKIKMKRWIMRMMMVFAQEDAPGELSAGTEWPCCFLSQIKCIAHG